MSDDASREFKIKITTAADTAGVRLTSAEIDRLTAALKKSSAEQLAAGKSSEKFELSTRELRKGLHEVGQILLPGIGRAAGELAYGPFGAILALGAAAEFFRSRTEKAAEAVKQLADEEADLDTATWQAHRDALNEATDSLRKYNEEMDGYLRKLNDQAAAEKVVTEQIELQAKARQAILEAQEKLEKAQPGADVDEIERRYGRRKSKAQIDAEAAQIAQNQSALDAASGKTGGLRGRADELQRQHDELTRNEAPTADLDATKTKGAELEKTARETLAKFWHGTFDELLAKQKEFNEGADWARGQTDIYARTKDGSALLSDVRDMARTLNNAVTMTAPSRKAVEDNRAKQTELNSLIDKHKADLEQVDNALKIAKEEYDKNIQAVKRYTDAINSLTPKYKSDVDTARSTGAIDALKPGVIEAIVGGMMKAIADAAKGKFDASDNAALENFQSLMDLVGHNSSEVISALAHAKDALRAQNDEIKGLRAQLQKIANDATHRPPPSSMPPPPGT